MFKESDGFLRLTSLSDILLGTKVYERTDKLL